MILALLAVGAACAALWLYQRYNFFSRLGVNSTTAVPVLGDLGWLLLQKEHITDVLTRTYQSFPDDRMVGRFEFLKPYILIKDPELLKKITVRDFDHFVDRSIAVDPETDPLIARSLGSLKGDEWKTMRSVLSPAFTSSKIRQMVTFMIQVADLMVESLKTKIEMSKVDYIDTDAKEVSSRYANDVIATCAFGLDVNSQSEDNAFYSMSKEITSFNFVAMLRLVGLMIVPRLMKILQLHMFSDKIRTFYSNVVLGSMKQREDMGIHRPDMIHLLMEAKKGQLSHDTKSAKDEHAGFATVGESAIGKTKTKIAWSDVDLVAQAVLFLFAGYETVSATMSFLLHELAVNPEHQERLVQEIRENERKNNGKFDYDSVQHMTYLDMVVSEVLRKWPGVAVVDRLCVRDYNLGRPNPKASKDVILRKGQSVQISLWVFHHDPNYFPEPEKFDPKRFSEENKRKIDPFVYMPFGLGPRNCIGSRFALCEVKVMTYQLLRHMEVLPCEKTTIPLRLNRKDGFRMTVEGGNWLRLRLRKE